MIVSVVVATTYVPTEFSGMQFPVFARKYPSLCYLGLLLQEASSETVLQVLAGSHLTQTTVPKGTIVLGSVNDWSTSIPRLLVNPVTREFGAKANALFSKLGISCR
jgi:hypothetical protein